VPFLWPLGSLIANLFFFRLERVASYFFPYARTCCV
jgi:hypothetical protein